MSILHQARARRKAGQEAEAGQDAETSPVKTVLGSLAVNTIHTTVTTKTHHVDKNDLDSKKTCQNRRCPF